MTSVISYFHPGGPTALRKFLSPEYSNKRRIREAKHYCRGMSQRCLTKLQKQYLQQQHTQDIESLFGILKSPSKTTRVRLFAGKILAALSVESAIPDLLALALDPNCLSSLSAKALSSVEELLQDYPNTEHKLPLSRFREMAKNANAEAKLRISAALLLARINDVQAVPILRQLLLESYESIVALAAAEGLAYPKPPYLAMQATDVLLAGLHAAVWEKNYPVRSAIVKALETLDAHESITDLVESFHFPEDDDDEDAPSIYRYNCNVLRALAHFRDSSAVPAITNILQESLELLDLFHPARHPGPHRHVSDIIKCAIQALASIQDPSCIDRLIDLANHEHFDFTAMCALESFGPDASDVVPAAQRLLREPKNVEPAAHPLLREPKNVAIESALNVLAAVGANAAPALSEILHYIAEGTNSEKVISLFALTRMGVNTPEVQKVLEQHLKHHDREVRLIACTGLLRLQLPAPLPFSLLLEAYQERMIGYIACHYTNLKTRNIFLDKVSRIEHELRIRKGLTWTTTPSWLVEYWGTEHELRIRQELTQATTPSWLRDSRGRQHKLKISPKLTQANIPSWLKEHWSQDVEALKQAIWQGLKQPNPESEVDLATLQESLEASTPILELAVHEFEESQSLRQLQSDLLQLLAVAKQTGIEPWQENWEEALY